jgi:hypothetical protein
MHPPTGICWVGCPASAAPRPRHDAVAVLRRVSLAAANAAALALLASSPAYAQFPFLELGHALQGPGRNDTTGDRAWILPYGDSTPSTEVDWAGLVNNQSTETVDWSLRSRQLAIDPSQPYRVCFKVRSFPIGAGSGVGRVLLGDGASASGPNEDDRTEENAVYMDETFPITDTWARVCTSSAAQAQAGDNLLKFGHIQNEPEYLVDDVEVLQL